MMPRLRVSSLALRAPASSLESMLLPEFCCCLAARFERSASRRDIRLDLDVETARLNFWKDPDRTFLGLRPHADATLRSLNATTPRLQKSAARTPFAGLETVLTKDGKLGERRRNTPGTHPLHASSERPKPTASRERRENKRHIQATPRRDFDGAMIFA